MPRSFLCLQLFYKKKKDAAKHAISGSQGTHKGQKQGEMIVFHLCNSKTLEARTVNSFKAVEDH